MRRRMRDSVRVRRLGAGLVLAVTTVVLVPGTSSSAATPPPNVFSVRLEGVAVLTNTFTTASSANPGSGASFAKIDSVPNLDGERDLEMAALATNNSPGDLGGAVIFAPTAPTNQGNVPGYTEAFFPVFEGFSTVSEKCAANNTNREAPECREQPGPYALSRVVPDPNAPRSIGTARNGGQDGQGDTLTRSEVFSDDTGLVIGQQENEGRRMGVPGTPITVDSFRAAVEIKASPEKVEATGECTAKVSVGGQAVVSNDQLQQLLGPFSTSTGVTVKYVPPTPVTVVDTPGGGKEVFCTGPQFTVSAPLQGETGTTYTYGETFGAAGLPANREAADVAGGGGDVGVPPVGGGGGGGTGGVPSTSPSTSPTGVDGSDGTTGGGTPAPGAAPPAVPGGGTESAPASGADEQAAGLVERRIDTVPLAVGTAVAGTLLPLAVWLLLGVTGSLARGYTRLRLPPFHDPVPEASAQS